MPAEVHDVVIAGEKRIGQVGTGDHPLQGAHSQSRRQRGGHLLDAAPLICQVEVVGDGQHQQEIEGQVGLLLSQAAQVVGLVEVAHQQGGARCRECVIALGIVQQLPRPRAERGGVDAEPQPQALASMLGAIPRNTQMGFDRAGHHPTKQPFAGLKHDGFAVCSCRQIRHSGQPRREVVTRIRQHRCHTPDLFRQGRHGIAVALELVDCDREVLVSHIPSGDLSE